MADLQTLTGKAEPTTEVTSTVGHYGVPDHMRTGFSNVKSGLTSTHPLESTEKNFLQSQEMLDFKMLRNTQGLHAPLKLQMERAVASKIQRLPCLPSSMVALDTLMGTDESIGFEDFLNVAGDSEFTCDPHLTMEYKLGLH
ncbi:proteasome maturation protein-like [Montipora capricornis]|uniref:proteasome maturation protein-like n=1 Tax=Montipora foliosa TaxID=591990 RepID=UPI0035F136E4